MEFAVETESEVFGKCWGNGCISSAQAMAERFAVGGNTSDLIGSKSVSLSMAVATMPGEVLGDVFDVIRVSEGIKNPCADSTRQYQSN